MEVSRGIAEYQITSIRYQVPGTRRGRENRARRPRREGSAFGGESGGKEGICWGRSCESMEYRFIFLQALLWICLLICIA